MGWWMQGGVDEADRLDAEMAKHVIQRAGQMLRPYRSQCLAALGLSWRKRADAGATIDVPCLDFDSAQLVLLPAEAYLEFQLMAQAMRPDSLVMVMGYGESAPGYIPTEKAVEERDGNQHGKRKPRQYRLTTYGYAATCQPDGCAEAEEELPHPERQKEESRFRRDADSQEAGG